MSKITYVELDAKFIQKQLDLIVTEYANKLQKLLSSTSPSSSGSGGKYGHLKSNWEVTTVDKKPLKLAIHAGKKGYVTHFLEFGTSKMSPQPFVARNAEDVINAMLKELNTIKLDIKSKTKTI